MLDTLCPAVRPEPDPGPALRRLLTSTELAALRELLRGLPPDRWAEATATFCAALPPREPGPWEVRR